MTERLFDKEAVVRVHAIHSMARLQVSFYAGFIMFFYYFLCCYIINPKSLPVEDGIQLTVLDIFLDLLRHDPSPDVRRAALIQIETNEKSLPCIIERCRDVDVSIRRLFYSDKMEEIDILALTIQQRDEILKAGLSDR